MIYYSNSPPFRGEQTTYTVATHSPFLKRETLIKTGGEVDKHLQLKPAQQRDILFVEQFYKAKLLYPTLR